VVDGRASNTGSFFERDYAGKKSIQPDSPSTVKFEEGSKAFLTRQRNDHGANMIQTRPVWTKLGKRG
jgi:hypothetical protein